MRNFHDDIICLQLTEFCFFSLLFIFCHQFKQQSSNLDEKSKTYGMLVVVVKCHRTDVP